MSWNSICSCTVFHPQTQYTNSLHVLWTHTLEKQAVYQNVHEFGHLFLSLFLLYISLKSSGIGEKSRADKYWDWKRAKGFPQQVFCVCAFKIELIISKDDIVWRCLNERCRIKMIKVNRHGKAVVPRPKNYGQNKWINENWTSARRLSVVHGGYYSVWSSRTQNEYLNEYLNEYRNLNCRKLHIL